jgi:uncharacterized membrane protein
MKEAVLILLVILALLLLFGVDITLKPLAVRVTSWHFGIGWLLIIIGISLIRYNAAVGARRELMDEVMDEIEKVETKQKTEPCQQSPIKRATLGFQALEKAFANIAVAHPNTKAERSMTTVITVEPGDESESKD